MESRFDISAGELKIKHEPNLIEKEKKEEVPKLTLAPFTYNTKLCFENSVVGTTAVQQLIVENPKPHDINVTIKSLPVPELRITLSWESCLILANDSVILEIYWTPDIVGSWRHTLTFQFGRCLKKDLPITFKSITSKKNTVTSKGVVTSKKKSLKHQSLITSPVMQKNFRRSTTTTNKKHKPLGNDIIFRTGKENIRPKTQCIPRLQFSDNNEIFYSPSDTSFTIESLNNINRDTYTVKEIICNAVKQNCTNISEDSLEISSDVDIPDNLELRSDMPSDDLHTVTMSPCSPFSLLDGNDLANISTATYVKGNISTDTYVKGNISTETYVKGNISTETYVKENISSETYVKGNISNLSTCTYLKHDFVGDNSLQSPKKCESLLRSSTSLFKSDAINNELDLNMSPILLETTNTHHVNNMSGIGVRKILEGNRWGTNDQQTYVDNNYSPTRKFKLKPCLKRKSDLRFELTPVKRSYLADQKTESSHEQHLNWNKSKKITKNNHETTDYFDPYMVKPVYQNEQWMERQEIIFQKWLNALLTPPAELHANVDGQPINVAKIWQECKRNPVPVAPSKELVSNKYHTNHRLDSLRKSAFDLFCSHEVSNVLTKIMAIVESQKLIIREDKNVHLDLGLRSEVMVLFLSYNPLWLRIGLETLYNTVITLNSNSDIIGLTNFIMQRFFKDSILLEKFKTVHSPKYDFAIKKFILKKFLALVYFLDVAKSKILIPHDPCLFRKNAPIKESREILLKFSRELISSVGDITKVLYSSGYVVNHVQKYIQEFDYSVIHLGVDLRDGVRLTKVMEIILIKTGLIACLRVPAVSRLQKLHNMKKVFEALTDANFQIIGEISPKDIVDGHYEKTLSFLWQIIYKFQAPLMIKAAIKIRKWWKSLPITMYFRIIKRRKRIQSQAAIKIQTWYRRQLQISKLFQIIQIVKEILRSQFILKCTIKIQSYLRMYTQRRRYLLMRKSAIILQKCIRGYLVRKIVKVKYESILKIQSYIRMWIIKRDYLKMRVSAIHIQHAYRAKQLMVKQRNDYLRIKRAANTIQTLFRANQAMKLEYTRFKHFKSAVIFIQRKFRANRLMKLENSQYNKLKKVTVFVQLQFRANKMMQIERSKYQSLKRAVLITQKLFRANRLMKRDHAAYNQLRRAAIVVQTRYRANQKMKISQARYQNFVKAAIIIQRQYRANKEMQIQYLKYQTLKQAVVSTQKLFRAKQLMNIQQAAYNHLKRATIILQTRFRANQKMKIQRDQYQIFLKAVLIIQQRFRANKVMQAELSKYQILKNAVLITQQRFRANLLMKRDHAEFHRFKRAVIVIQTRFRANRMMKTQQISYENLVKTAVIIQQRFRSTKLMRIEYQRHQNLKSATITIQRYYRSYKLMRSDRSTFLSIKWGCTTIQTLFRANKIAKIELVKYQKLRNAVILIQRQYRAQVSMIHERAKFNNLKKCTIYLQNKFRANVAMQKDYLYYQKLKSVVIKMQRRLRASQLMKKEYSNYQQLKITIIQMQRRFRANRLMKQQHVEFIELKKITIFIQRQFRANRLMKVERNTYISYRRAAVHIQRKYRATTLMKLERNKFNDLRKAAITIQRCYRSKLAMRKDFDMYRAYVKSIICVQRRFRAKQLMRIAYSNYCNTRKAAITIQTWFKFNRCKKLERRRFLEIRNATVTIQQRWRKFIPLHRDRKLQIKAVIKLQAFWRGYLVRKDHPEVAKIRRKVEDISSNVLPENTLGQRRERAVQMLIENPTLLQMLRALEDLDFITRRCKNTLLEMCECLPEQLYIIIIAANRSPGEMEASAVATSILINFYKFSNTSEMAWIPAYIRDVIVVMSHCCDKEDKLFPYLCTLLWLFSHNEIYKDYIRSLPQIEQIFMKIKALCLRKQRMLLLKSYTNSFQFFSIKSNEPSVVPDWGIDYGNRPRIFTNSMQALCSVLKILNIS